VEEIEVFEGSPGGPEIGTLEMLGLPTRTLESRAFWEFPAIFDEFREKQFTLLWRGRRDGCAASEFHSRCDGHQNTLTVILDTKGHICGGFTPVEWESRQCNDENNYWKTDASLKCFIFTLKNPHNVPARRFSLKAQQQDRAIVCMAAKGPNFDEIYVCENCNASTDSGTLGFGWMMRFHSDISLNLIDIDLKLISGTNFNFSFNLSINELSDLI
jgi:hypothetical protein